MSSIYSDALTARLQRAASEQRGPGQVVAPAASEEARPDFATYLRQSLLEVDRAQKQSDEMAANLATGKSENIHETMLALSQAEIGFKLMVQVRNKVLESYQEIMRLQV